VFIIETKEENLENERRRWQSEKKEARRRTRSLEMVCNNSNFFLKYYKNIIFYL